MGRNVVEIRKVVGQIGQGVEELIKQQGVGEEFVLGENEEEKEENEQEKQKEEENSAMEEVLGNKNSFTEKDQEEVQQEKGFEKIVMLTGATTYLDSGTRYFKNKQVKVAEKETYERLLRTGLFVCI